MKERTERECILSELAAMAPILERVASLNRRLADLGIGESSEDLNESLSDDCGDEDTEPEDDISVNFHDSSLSIDWNGGSIQFRSDGEKMYRFIKEIYEAGETGIEHEEIAEILYNDQLANIRKMIENARKRLENNKFPLFLKNNGKNLKFV